MNVIELLTVFLILFVGWLVGKSLDALLGTFGMVAGFILGCILAIVIYSILRAHMDLSFRWPMFRPRCKA